MVAQPIPIAPGLFRAEGEEPAQVLDLTQRIRPSTERVSVTARAGRPSESATARQPARPTDALPMQCLLAVEGGAGRVSLTLPMRSTPVDPPSVYEFETPCTVRGLKLYIRVSADGQGALQVETDYTGLDASRALSYARFLDALRWEDGRFTVSAYVKGRPLHLATIALPLPFGEDDRERSRQELKFWEAVHEVSRETGTKLVCPTEITEEDHRNLNFVLGAVRRGWVVERVKDFTIPPTEELAENLIRIVEEEGDELRAMALVTEHERFEIFGAGMDLGACVRRIAKARMLTPLDEIRGWLAADPTQRKTLVTRWEPVDEAPLHVMFPEWPKPSLDRVRSDLKAFEDEYGMDTSEFLEGWEAGAPDARAVEDGDVWLTLASIERAMAERN